MDERGARGARGAGAPGAEAVPAGGASGWVRRRLAPNEPKTEPAAPEPTPTDEPAAIGTFVDLGAEFEGTLRLRDSFRIDSEFRGDIVCEDTVVVGESAGLVANIHAREVIVIGAVVGNVTAARQVVIRSTGKLHGDVEAPCLEIEKGAVFNGRSTMVRPEVAARAGARTTPRVGDEPGRVGDEPGGVGASAGSAAGR